MQAFGHGLYFAENPKVAQTYHTILGESTIEGLTKDEIASLPADLVDRAVAGKLTKADLAERIASFRKAGDVRSEKMLPALERLAAMEKVQASRAGGLYEVKIKAKPEEFLDWDKPLGDKQVLEVNFAEVSVKTYTINADVIANYLGANYNPEASSGTVTIGSVALRGRIAGSFDLQFPGGDHLMGTFDAPYCATGMEP